MLDEKELEQFKEDYLDGMTLKSLKKKYSIGSNGLLYRVIDQLRLESRQQQPDDYITKEEFVQYYITENHSLKDTKKHFNISTSKFYKIVEMYNIEKPVEAQVERVKKTCLERYGVTNGRQVPAISDKIAKTNLERYGSISPFGNKDIRARIEAHFKEKWGGYPLSTQEIQDKVRASAIGNSSYSHSKPEEKMYSLLIDRFGQGDVIRQHKTIEYPFYCDFYIKSLNLYLEGNFSHFHHRKPFDPLSDEDQIELQNLLEKAKEKEYYYKVIKTWTESDPYKRKIARDNNLNWIEFFTLEELKVWLSFI